MDTPTNWPTRREIFLGGVLLAMAALTTGGVTLPVAIAFSALVGGSVISGGDLANLLRTDPPAPEE